VTRDELDVSVATWLADVDDGQWCHWCLCLSDFVVVSGAVKKGVSERLFTFHFINFSKQVSRIKLNTLSRRK